MSDSSQDDAKLFRTRVGEVYPLKKQNRITPKNSLLKNPTRSVHGKSTVSNNLAVNYPVSGLRDFEEKSEYSSSGIQKNVLRKLKRTEVAIQLKLDLHGYNLEQARELLLDFIEKATKQGVSRALVIHGKGLNSLDGEAVLRKYSRLWLTRHPHVLAYCDAPANLGGSGAALVLLKKNSSVPDYQGRV